MSILKLGRPCPFRRHGTHERFLPKLLKSTLGNAILGNRELQRRENSRWEKRVLVESWVWGMMIQGLSNLELEVEQGAYRSGGPIR
jgi:hypothetical protein